MSNLVNNLSGVLETTRGILRSVVEKLLLMVSGQGQVNLFLLDN